MRNLVLAVLLVLGSRAPAAGRPAFGPVGLADARWTAGFWVAFWLVVLPSVLSGTFDVLVPLRRHHADTQVGHARLAQGCTCEGGN